jgi:retron-type reverse transcriptase
MAGKAAEVTKAERGANLKESFDSLLTRKKSFKHKPQPALKRYAPKYSKGKNRPLGLSA